MPPLLASNELLARTKEAAIELFCVASVAVAALAAAKAAVIELFCVVFIPSMAFAEAKEAFALS